MLIIDPDDPDKELKALLEFHYKLIVYYVTGH
jgi:hypothetical protein